MKTLSHEAPATVPASGSTKPPTTFAVIGGGYRAGFFLRVAQALPHLFRVCGVVARREESRTAVEREWGVCAYPTLAELLDEATPDFAVVSVSAGAAPGVIADAASRGLPVLTETPPAPDLEGLLSLYWLVEDGARIQVAEQYHLEPLLSAQIAVARSGRLGSVAEAFASVCHGYHGVSVLRRLLGIGFENAEVTAHEFRSRMQAGPDRSGDPQEDHLIDEAHVSARLDFGGRLGVFDFTTDQYRSWIRSPHVLVRGDRGELRDTELRYVEDFRTPMRSEIRRIGAGHAGNHEGMFLRGLVEGGNWLYRNPFAPARLADDELSVAALLQGMADYVHGGPEVYSLAEACQDQYLALTIQQSVESGKSIRTKTQPWAAA
ncbi:putative dehydrogenase [Arthrobacter sp. PvP102]|uniref:Gfo/Idh/MocA family protein n=1 Tax=unclassified Arthrobacter TaxID=235627 RepID=UPI001AE3BD32|nr:MULTISPECIES: Gfo/Idh/MocA family oxidoreductase [unclassified Arthrobacter]MBP1233060.1 putative dehydrogenase [Arthrobacter sp. PvP103]MBP1238195.1 putative dehydrogenase [Arthrobacter sp. PvP102]